MKKKDYLSGLAFLIIASILFFQSRQLMVWDDMGPSEGFLPFVSSILLGVLSLIIMIHAYLKPEEGEKTLRILGPRKKKFILYGTSFIIYGLIFSKVGYSLTLGLFLVFILKVVEKQSWRMTFVVTAIAIFSSYLLFAKAFSIPLPEGILSPITQALR
jgi:hypothetical protein